LGIGQKDIGIYMMSRLGVLTILITAMLIVASCTGNDNIYPNVTPTIIPPTFFSSPVPTVLQGQTPQFNELGTPYCFTDTIPNLGVCTQTPTPNNATPLPTTTRTPTPTRTSTRTPNPITSTPRPPTITPIGTQNSRDPIGTPDCGNYDCGNVKLPELPLLDSPTPYITPTSLFDGNVPILPTSDPRTLVALNITPVTLNGTEVGADDLLNPIDGDAFDDSNNLWNQLTPVFGGGTGDAFGNGGTGLGFGGDGNNVIQFGMTPNDTIWIAYAKGLLLDPNVNYFGPFAPLILLVMTYLSLQFILLVANGFISIIAAFVGILRKLFELIINFLPFV
jgi:hypothetical protein